MGFWQVFDPPDNLGTHETYEISWVGTHHPWGAILIDKYIIYTNKELLCSSIVL